MRLLFILNRSDRFDLKSQYFSSSDLKRAAKFWCGKAAIGFRQDDLTAELGKAFESRSAVADVLGRLSAKEKEILAVTSRYGTRMSGSLLAAELTARGLTLLTHRTGYGSYYARQAGDVAAGLLEKHVLLRAASDYEPWEHSHRAYSDIRIPPLVSELVKPAAPHPWPSSGADSAVSTGEPRSPGEVAIDLLKVAEALRGLKSWQTTREGMLTKNSQKKIAKIVPLPAATDDPLALPDPWAFYYELLQKFGFLDVESRTVRDAKLEKVTQEIPYVQVWNHLRVWLNLEFWQDGKGIGGSTSRYNDTSRSLEGRCLVVWAMCRVAQSSQEWFDLEAFLLEFHRCTRLQPIAWEIRGGVWRPEFEGSRNKEKLAGGEERSLAFWLDEQGTWVANVVMVTFAALGLIERGQIADKPHQHCFRLTPLGRAIFGGPEIQFSEPHVEARFLAVLPNHDVLAYLDSADSRSLDLLTRIAECTSTTGKVQTFAIRRDFVYRALESGRTLDGIRKYFEEHGRTPLPPTVDRALTEWAGKRDSLVVRSGVTVAVDPSGTLLKGGDVPHRGLGATSAVLRPLDAKEADHLFGNWLPVDHALPERKSWRATEMGLIHAEQIDSVSRVRLSLFAEQTDEGWQITRESIQHALRQKLGVTQILEWLQTHLTHAIPPLLKTAIRNWSTPESVYLGKVHVLQVPQTETCAALLASPTFMRLMAEHIPPRWFLIEDPQWAKVKKLLLQLGFAFDDTWQSRPFQFSSDEALAAKIGSVQAVRQTRSP